MKKLLMISGFGGSSLALGKRGAFYNTLEEFHKYWDRIDIICPKVANNINSANPKSKTLNPKQIQNYKPQTLNLFNNVFIHPSPWPLWLQPLWILREGIRILKTNNYKLQTKNYIMTVHEYPPFYNGIGSKVLASKIGVPYILEIHHIPGYPKAAGGKEAFYRWLTKKFIRFDASGASAVRVVNQKQVPSFLIGAGIRQDKIKYIPSMYIDLEVFQPMSGETKKYDLVFAGRLEKNKNTGMLIKAISKVKSQNPEVKLLIIGNGPEKENLKSEIKNLNLENNVFLAGWLPMAKDVARAYNSARIFINPSLNEGGPRVALEAMACGLPVITTRVGIMNDIIIEGETGLFIEWTAYDMSEKIKKLLNDNKLQETFSQAGVGISRQFERKKIIENYAGELLNIAKQSTV